VSFHCFSVFCDYSYDKDKKKKQSGWFHSFLRICLLLAKNQLRDLYLAIWSAAAFIYKYIYILS